MKKYYLVIGRFIMFAGILFGTYLGGWLLLLKPLIEIVININYGTLTGWLLFTSILKCIFAPFVGLMIAYVFALVSTYFLTETDYKEEDIFMDETEI